MWSPGLLFGFTVDCVPSGSKVLAMAKTFDPDGTQSTVKPNSKPGDHIEFRALRDLIVGLSNCPQVRNECNGFQLTSIKVVIFKDGKSASHVA